MYNLKLMFLEFFNFYEISLIFKTTLQVLCVICDFSRIVTIYLIRFVAVFRSIDTFELTSNQLTRPLLFDVFQNRKQIMRSV